MPHPVVIAIHDPAIRSVVAGSAPTTVEASAPVLVTDQLDEAAATDSHVAFVSRSLPAIIRAMMELKVCGVLLPADVTATHLTAIGNGVRIYSSLTADDLDLDTRRYQAVSAAAQSTSLESAAATLGYSVRQLYRDLRSVLDEASVAGRFSWSMLAPPFPTDATGGTT